MIPAARIALERRERLTISIICLKPRPMSPTTYATAPWYVTSPEAMERDPNLSLRRLSSHGVFVASGGRLGGAHLPRPRRPAGGPSRAGAGAPHAPTGSRRRTFVSPAAP